MGHFSPILIPKYYSTPVNKCSCGSKRQKVYNYETMRSIIYIIINAFAALSAAYILPGISLHNWVTALVVAVVLGVLNAVVRPILIFMTLPVTVVTLGLFLLVINAVMVLLAAWLVPGFKVDGFWWALAFSVTVSLINSVLLALT